MLRITTERTSRAVTLQLEGRLEGAWVVVLTKCWSKARDRLNGRQLRLDLNGVTFVDAMGRARLGEMNASGVRLIADDIEIKAIVAEIQNKSGESRKQ